MHWITPGRFAVFLVTAGIIAALLGADFDLVESVNDDHQTPAGGVQTFSFGRFIRKASLGLALPPQFTA